MRINRYANAIKSLSEIIGAELVAAWKLREGGPSIGDIHVLSRALAQKIFESKDVANAISQAMAQPPDWISTEEAAKMSGFSRPFIVAAIDSGIYTGRVNKTPKGHRRVLSGEFHEWIEVARAKNVPVTLAEARSGFSGEPLDERSPKAEKSRRQT